MGIYLSMLRGINVSGQKMIKMDALKKMYEGLGFKNVATYIQSGNVIFESSTSKNLSQSVERKITETFGFEVPVIIRTQKEMQEIAKRNPFIKEKDIDPERIYITYLSEAPSAENIAKINTSDFSPERFIIIEKEVCLYVPKPGTYGNTKLNNNFFENKLKVKATTRNLKTSNTLLQMMT